MQVQRKLNRDRWIHWNVQLHVSPLKSLTIHLSESSRDDLSTLCRDENVDEKWMKSRQQFSSFFFLFFSFLKYVTLYLKNVNLNKKHEF